MEMQAGILYQNLTASHLASWLAQMYPRELFSHRETILFHKFPMAGGFNLFSRNRRNKGNERIEMEGLFALGMAGKEAGKSYQHLVQF